MPPLFLDSNLPTIELYGVAGTTALWGDPASKWGDTSTRWDDPSTAFAWRSVACQVSAFRSSWGADEGTGVLAQSAAGTLTLQTYDPDRLLDPSNPASPLAKARAIGNPVRLRSPAPVTVLGYGYVDELAYTFEDQTGTLTAVDDVATLAQAQTAPGFWQPSNGLIAFAAAAIASAGQSVPVGAAPAAGDPVIAYSDTRNKAAWALIKEAATDALCFAWIDRLTSPPTLRFSPFGYPTDPGLTLGDGGIPMGSMGSTGSAAGVANVVDDATGELARVPSAVGRDQVYDTSRVEPAGAAWGQAIVADRATATVTLVPGEIYPQSVAQLRQLALLRGIDLVRIVLLEPGLDVTLRCTGLVLEGEAGGVYRARLAAYAPGAPWAYLPPPPASVAATPSSRSVTATKDSTIYFGGSIQPGSNRRRGYGFGPCQVGLPTIYQYASLFAFDGLDLTGVRRIRKIELVLRLGADLAGAVAIEVQRVDAQWQEGTAKSTDAGSAQAANAVVWPGPAVAGAVVAGSIPAGVTGAETRIDITAAAMVTMPVELGGRGYPAFGYRVYPTGVGGSGAATLAARETDDNEPTGTGCRLELTVEV